MCALFCSGPPALWSSCQSSAPATPWGTLLCFADTGVVTTVAGSPGREGRHDGPGSQARLTTGIFGALCTGGGSVLVTENSMPRAVRGLYCPVGGSEAAGGACNVTTVATLEDATGEGAGRLRTYNGY